MSKKTPEAPKPPDYAAANEAAIQADVNTLGLRNAINAAATLGKTYTDPATGRTYDFTGLGSQDVAHAQLMQQLADAPESARMLLQLQQQYGPAFAEQARQSLQATDPTGFALRDQLGGRLAGGANSLEGLVQSQQGGPGTPAQADYEAYVRNNPDLLRNWQDNTSRNTQLTLAEYGKQHYNEHGRAEGRNLPMTAAQSSPGSIPVYEKLAGNGPALANLAAGPALDRVAAGADLGRLSSSPQLQQFSARPDLANVSSLPQLQQFNVRPDLAALGDAEALQRITASPDFARVGGPQLADTGASQAGRSLLEQQVFDELAKAGNPDAALTRSVEQAARARGAATGNLLGDSSALQEALAVQNAQRGYDADRRSAAMALLSSGQTTSDTLNRLGLQQQQADIAGAGFNNSALQQAYQNQANNVSLNNSAAMQDRAARERQVAFNNAAQQQDYQNQANNAAFNNAASQQGYQNDLSRLGFNNAAQQQDYQNQANNAAFNNAARQQGYQNDLSRLGFNNAAQQQDADNRLRNVAFNNTASQQEFANRGAVVDQNNSAASQAFQNAMAAINQRNQASQNTFAASQQGLQQRIGARQQDLANIQSFLGLQPIVAQGGQLGGLQQGAAPFVSGTGYSALGTNPNAGAQGTAFASNVFGTQAGIYGQQLANSQSPLGAIAGGFLGAASGGAGAGLGKRLGNIFGGGGG